MAGQIKRLIDSIVEQRAQGNKVLVGVVKMKLILKGIDPKSYTDTSPDDPAVLSRLLDLQNDLKM